MKSIFICDDGNAAEAALICLKYNFGIEIQAFYDPALVNRDHSAIDTHNGICAGIGLRSLHGCFGDLCPGSFDEMVRGVARNRFDLSYSIAVKLGATHLVLHDGYVPHTSVPRGWITRTVKFWKNFLLGKDERMSFHIENVLEWEPQLIADIIDGIGSSHVDANLDIGHVNCNAKVDINSWITCLGHRIGYTHLHDNQGKDDEHLGLGRGSIRMKDTLQFLEEYCPDAIWAIEAEGIGIQQSVDWLSKEGFLENNAHG